MKETLAVKYRPKTFEDVIGQEYIKELLVNQIETGNIGKAYLYAGASGIGKTTVARIFAKELDAEVYEIDAASNNGVDNIRTITDNVKYKPLQKERKVYIVDECHMLSKQAWNALLKTLEEPPSYAVFILATTEPHKVIPTIISRSQRLNFTRPETPLIVNNLRRIVKEENCDVSEEVLSYIAKLSEGGVRLSITMLESCLNIEGDLTIPRVEKVLGHIPTQYFIDLIWEVTRGSRTGVIDLINTYHLDGVDFSRFIENLVMFVLDLQKYIVTRNMMYLRTSSIYEDDIRGILNNIISTLDEDIDKLQSVLNNIIQKVSELYYSSQKLEPKKYLLEAALLDLTF